MDQSVLNNQSSRGDDSMPGQPEKKRYTICFWREGVDAVVCEAENEKQAESWFFDFFQRHNQQTSPRLMLGIDDLGVVKDDQPVQELSEAAFLATARELKATRLAPPEKRHMDQQEPSTEHHEMPGDQLTLKAKTGEPEIRCYRIWYSYATFKSLECVAETEEKAAEWFRQWCQTHEGEITTHSLESIEEQDVEAAKEHEKMLGRAEEPTLLGMEDQTVKPERTVQDFFAALERMKEAMKEQV